MTNAKCSKLLDDQQLEETLDRSKGRLFFKKGAAFLAALACNHEYIWSDRNRTAWCDGETIGINPEFWSELSPENRITLLAHELWHTGYDHMGRCGKRDPKIWNKAADYRINLDLHNAGFDFTGMNPLLDPQYGDMATEKIYEILAKGGQQGNAPDTSDQGNGQSGEGSLPSDDGFDLGSDVVSKSGEAGAKQQLAVMKKVVQATQSAMLSGDPGSVPGEIKIHIDKFFNPVLPWEVLLERFMNELSKDDYSWRRPSRRHDEEYLPSLLGENGLEHLIYYLDISGSVSDEEIAVFNSEVSHIHRSLVPKRLTLVTFDTKIRDVYEFTDEDEFKEIEVQGRGGTCLKCVHEHIKKHIPTAAVIFSDMYVRPMESDPRVPILWAVLDNENAEVPFGKIVHITREALDKITE